MENPLILGNGTTSVTRLVFQDGLIRLQTLTVAQEVTLTDDQFVRLLGALDECGKLCAATTRMFREAAPWHE